MRKPKHTAVSENGLHAEHCANSLVLHKKRASINAQRGGEIHEKLKQKLAAKRKEQK